MGVISRFTDIMSANINSLLSKAESGSADKLLEKYLQDAKDNLGQVKAETAATIAEEMSIARKINDNDALHKKYEGYAQAALKSQNEDDAKKFVQYQMDLETQKAELQKQYDAAKQNSEKMREMTNKLVGDISKCQAKLDEAKQTLTMAKQQENMNKINEKLSSNPLENTDSLFDEIQKRADEAQAAADLQSQIVSGGNDIEELAKKYDEQSGNGNPARASIEDRIAQMKAGLQQ